MITINLELLDYFFPQERPLEAEIWNIAVLFSLGKKLILDCRNRTNLNNIVEKMNKRACVTHGPCLLVGAYSFSASAEACFLPAVAAVVPCLRASLLAPLLGGIAGGVRLCCPLGQSKTERVARPPHRGQLPPPYRNWGQLLLPSRGGARHVLLCYECFIPWAFPLLWTKPPRLGVKVPADRRLNAQRSCRRRRRVQRARDSHLRQWQIIARNLSVFYIWLHMSFPGSPPALKHSVRIAADHGRGVDQLLAIPLRAGCKNIKLILIGASRNSQAPYAQRTRTRKAKILSFSSSLGGADRPIGPQSCKAERQGYILGPGAAVVMSLGRAPARERCRDVCVCACVCVTSE